MYVFNNFWGYGTLGLFKLQMIIRYSVPLDLINDDHVLKKGLVLLKFDLVQELCEN